MLKEYLIVAQEALNAKKEIYQIKQQRFELAQEEYQQLHKMCEDDSRSHASCELTYLLLKAIVTLKAISLLGYLQTLNLPWARSLREGSNHILLGHRYSALKSDGHPVATPVARVYQMLTLCPVNWVMVGGD